MHACCLITTFLSTAELTQEEEKCVSAFKNGNMLMAEQLLPLISQPAAITTTYSLLMTDKLSEAVSLLHLAASWGWKNTIDALVSVYKCTADNRDNLGQTPLHYAACKGHLEVVNYFVVKLHCDPMDKNVYNDAPLHYACRNGHLNIAQYLIREERCNPSCENNEGWTPLHYACENGHLNIAQYLIREEHCNPSCERMKAMRTVTSTLPSTPLHYAGHHCCRNGQHCPVHREEHCNHHVRTLDTTSHACRNGHLNIAQFIREEHCNPSCENNDGSTPLHYGNNHAHIVHYCQLDE